MSRRIVSNTGLLIALATIDRLDLLESLFDEVLVSEQVNQELLNGGKSFAGVAAYKNASWLEKHSQSTAIDPLLDSVLDLGEASVIQLAREHQIDLVLIDERRGRKIARNIYKLRVIGTAIILIEAKRAGLINNVGFTLNTIINNGYRIHKSIVSLAMSEAKEL
jgi:predicted nucleic acid-binding protein